MPKYNSAAALQCGGKLPYLCQPFQKSLVRLGNLHVIPMLLTKPYLRRNAQSRFKQQGVFGRYGTLAVQYLIEQRGGNAHLLCQFPLRNAPVLDFIFNHFPRMYRLRRCQVIGYHLRVYAFQYYHIISSFIMVRQFDYIAHGNNRLFRRIPYGKFNPVFIIHPNRRNPLLVTFQFFIIQ